MTLAKIKEYWKKTKYFLWEDNSIWSWMANLLLAFVIIKFLLYPGIGLALGTDLPVVAVISGSMEHDGSFDEWWQSHAKCENRSIIGTTTYNCIQADWYAQNGITLEEFRQFSMHNGFNKGDIIILKGSEFKDIAVGDIIVFQSGNSYPIIHRVVGTGDYIQTKGDNNAAQIISMEMGINEYYISKEQVIGKAWIKIPYIGYIKIWFADLARCVTFNGCRFS